MNDSMRHLMLLAGVVSTSVAMAVPVKWEFPRTGSCHEGLAFSDGVTGVLVWGGGDTLNLTVGRGDLWDHRGGYPWLESQSYSNIVSLVQAGKKDDLLSLFRNDPPPNWGGRYNPYMLPLGRVVVRIPGGELVSGELETQTGLGRLVIRFGDRTADVEIAMSKVSRTFALRLPEGADYEVRTLSAMDFPVSSKALRPRGFTDPERRDGPSEGGFLWALPADPSVSLAWTRRDREIEIRTARGGRAGTDRIGFDAVRAESCEQWRSFWAEGARIRVPDPEIQEIFEYGMYRFGAMTDPDGVPAGLQGPWLEDDRLVPWNGDFHFNINVQECYSPAYRGGHFANLMPLFRMVLSWRQRLRENARMFARIGDGYVLPHSVDDRGVCIGGFWTGTIDHASTAWVATLMYRYVRYSGDVAFLRDGVYDFMKGAMNVYRAMMEERDGRLSIPLGPSPEWGAADVQKAVGRDPSFQLAAAHRLARDLIAAAELLGESPDSMWQDVERRLPQYTSGPDGIQLFEGQPFEESHRHHSHMAGFYPFDTINAADPVNEETFRTWVMKGTGLWSGWCVPWASILHVHHGQAVAAVDKLHAWNRYFTNGGHGSCHDAQTPGFTVMMGRNVMQMDGQCAAVTAILELMAHEVNGETCFFRGCPESWRDVSFENVRLSDGRCVSGRRTEGHVKIWQSAAR